MRSSSRTTAAALACLLAGLLLAGCGAGGSTAGSPSTAHDKLTASVGAPAGSQAKTVTRVTRRRHCYASPMACGYPDPRARFPNAAYVGPHDATTSVPCRQLRPRSGVITVRTAGATLSDANVHGRIVVEAPNVTLEDVCVEWDASGNTNLPPAVEFEATGGRVIDSAVGGANATNQSVQIALGENVNTGYRLLADHDDLVNCSECVHNDGWTVKNSYIDANGRPCGSYDGDRCVGGIDHVEDIYCDTGSFTVDHDTLINPEDQTANVFCNTDNGGQQEPCANQLTVTDSLLAGSGFMIYGCSNGVPVGTSHMTVTGNRFARCTGHPVYQASTGGSTCSRANRSSRGDDGLWPYGGYYGWEADSYCPRAGGQVWSDNVWDNSDAPVRCVQDH